MTYKEVWEMLLETGILAAYHHFDEGNAPEPPFICFFYTEDNDFKADDTNYQQIEHLVIELYTDNKDFQTEKAVRDVLTAHGLVYSSSEDYIATERLYEVVFDTEIVITEEE